MRAAHNWKVVESEVHWIPIKSQNLELQSGSEPAGQSPFSPSKRPPSFGSFRFSISPNMAQRHALPYKGLQIKHLCPGDLRGTPITTSERISRRTMFNKAPIRGYGVVMFEVAL